MFYLYFILVSFGIKKGTHTIKQNITKAAALWLAGTPQQETNNNFCSIDNNIGSFIHSIDVKVHSSTVPFKVIID